MTDKRSLPKGWKFEGFPRCILKKSVRVSKIPETSYLEEGRYPIVDQGSNIIAGYTNDEKKLYKHDTPLIVFGDHTRIFKYIDFDFAIGADGTKIIHPNTEIVQPKFFYYVLKAADFPNDGYNRHYKYIQDLKLPIPLIRDDQIAIATELERKIKEVEKMRLAALRQKEAINAMQGAVLRGAFPYKPGDKLPEGWKWVKLRNISRNIQYGISKSASVERVGPKLLRITDIQEGKVNWSKVPYCECNDDERKNYLLEDKDIVFTRTGATTGKSFLVENPEYALFASYLIRVQCDKDIVNSHYLYAFFQSPSYWDCINQSARGGTLAGFNASMLSELEIPLPSTLDDQITIANNFERKKREIEKIQQDAQRQLAALEALPGAYLREVFEFADS